MKPSRQTTKKSSFLSTNTHYLGFACAPSKIKVTIEALTFCKWVFIFVRVLLGNLLPLSASDSDPRHLCYNSSGQIAENMWTQSLSCIKVLLVKEEINHITLAFGVAKKNIKQQACWLLKRLEWRTPTFVTYSLLTTSKSSVVTASSSPWRFQRPFFPCELEAFQSIVGLYCWICIKR